MNGSELLAEFRQDRSEAAFAELVRRYTNLVFSAAYRRLANTALAQDAAQTVFLRLAQGAPKLESDGALVAWLHRTTVHVSIDLWRAETRRHAREEKAVAMHASPSAAATPPEFVPELDKALDELEERDRLALLLRFFDGRSMRELGESLGVSEDAAKMRVSRSLERLRERLAARGIQCTAAVLGAFLAENAVQAAPVAVASALAGISYLSAGSSAVFGPMFLKAGIVAGVLGAAVFLLFKSGSFDAGSAARRSEVLEETRPAEVMAAAAAGPESSTNAVPDEPNAGELLRGIARARNRILSGAVELETSFAFPLDGIIQTNAVRISAVFEGVKRRFVQVGQEYHYVGVGEEGERAAATIREKKMDRQAAIKAGLLEPFDSRHVTAYDGTAVLDYWETDGKSFQAAIKEPSESSVYLVDPRCLGLRALSVTSEVDGHLALDCAAEAKIAGIEEVEGKLAWHVTVNCRGYDYDYWIDCAHPERLLKHTLLGDTIVARYTGPANDPLPTEIIETNERRQSVRRIARGRTEYNIVVDPSFCTLAGLGMKRGTDVVDYRTHRSLGYWSGEGLAEHLPSKRETNDVASANVPEKLTELVQVLETEAASERGFAAATSIILNNPDGAEVEAAGEAILRHHIQSTNLLDLCTRFETLRHRCTKPILREALAQNPEAEIRGRACYSLAQIWKDESLHGLNEAATKDARGYFERYLREFSKVGKDAPTLAHRSKQALAEMDGFFVGKTVPELRAATVDGQAIALSKLRGRVVLMIFWDSPYSEAEEHRRIYAKFAGQPVTFIGVNSDMKLQEALETIEKKRLTWPMIWEGNERPIFEAWHAGGWTTTFLIDQAGVIRNRELRWGKELEDGIQALLEGGTASVK